MNEPLAKPLSVELDVDAIKPIVSGLRSYGEAVVAGLKNGGNFPTVWDSFRQSIGEGWVVKGGDLEARDLVPDWKWYTRVQTGSANGIETASPDNQGIFQRKVVAQIRNLLWGRMSLSLPWYFWESLGIAAWGGGEFRLLYADAIRSILRERYILSADERKEVASLSPNSFWLLLSVAPPGLDPPVDTPYESIPDNYALRSCAYYPYKFIEYLKAEEEGMGMKFHDYMAVSEIQLFAKHQSQKECWANFWDQWFLGEISKLRNIDKPFYFTGLNQYLEKLPLFTDNRGMWTAGDSLEASISVPVDKLDETVPFWYANNIGYV